MEAMSMASETACPGENVDAGDIDAALAALVGGDDPAGWPAPGVAFAVMRGGAVVYAGAAGCAQLGDQGAGGACRAPMTPSTMFRAASVSKMATAFAALSLARDGLLDLDADVSGYYGFAVRNPAHPDAPITLRHLLSHVAGVRDPEEYWVAAPAPFRPLIEGDAGMYAAADGPPGARFVYSNLNYGVAAGAMEIAAGRRFDRIAAERVFGPLGLGAGFNWSGASDEARRRGATLYRLVDGAWTAQVDGPAMLRQTGPYFLAQPGLDRDAYLERYAPGDNPTLFSPQGGMRADVLDLARLASALAPGAPFAAAAAPLWRYDQDTDNGDTQGGMFMQYGLGTQTVEVDGRRLVGHSGEAYGLLSGAWLFDRETAPGDAPRSADNAPTSFAYAVTGTPAGALDNGAGAFTPPERRLIALGARIAARCAGEGAAAPRRR